MATDHRLDDLAVIYVGLAHGIDGRMHFNEFTQIADRLVQWQHPGDRRDVLELVDNAVASYCATTVEEAVNRLSRTMSGRERRAVLEDLSEIALADRRVLSEEAEFVGLVAEKWEIHPAADERGAFWSVLRARSLSAAQTAIHDLALLYLTVAIVPDEDASAEELSMLARRLKGWLPEANESHIVSVVRSALRAYRQGLAADQMDELLDRVASLLPDHQMSAVARDLRDIARADGEMAVEERVWIERIERRLAG